MHFVIVNTDPKATTISHEQQRAHRAGPEPATASVTLLSGSVDTLDRVWTAYGIRVIVGAKATRSAQQRAVLHRTQRQSRRLQRSPSARKNTSGRYSLDLPSLRTCARAIAETADSLVQ